MVLDGNLNPVAWTSGGPAPNSVKEGNGPTTAAHARAFLSLCGQQATSACAFSAGSPAATEAKFATLTAPPARAPGNHRRADARIASLFAIIPPECQ